jgi:hypothetical protein
VSARLPPPVAAAVLSAVRSVAAWLMSAWNRCRAASGSCGPARNAVVAVTSASDSDWYIRCASRLSGSMAETTSPAAAACWLTVQAVSAPQASAAPASVASSSHRVAGMLRAGRRRPGIEGVGAAPAGPPGAAPASGWPGPPGGAGVWPIIALMGGFT